MRFHGQSHDDDEEKDDERFFEEEYLGRDGGEDEDGGYDGDQIFYAPEVREFKIAELNLVGLNLNRRILVGVVKMLEKSFWWKFCSHKTKLRMIQESYRVFSQLISKE